MHTPSDLIRYESDADLAPATGVLVVALGGFVDAGNVQRLLVDHLLDSNPSSVLASFDVDQLLDFRSRRPMMVFETDRWVSYDDPAIVLHRLRDRDGQPFYLLAGPEPDYQWERVAEAVRHLMVRFGMTQAVSTHGIPMAVPHTRPVGMSAHATDPALIGYRTSPFGRVQVPASFPALLELRLGEAGGAASGFAIHVPHYLAQSEFAEGALAALNAITETTGLNLPNDGLAAAAGRTRGEIDAAVAGSAEVREVVSALEEQYDTFAEGQERPSLLATDASELPSADELGAEFEAFLKNVNDDPGASPG